MLEISNWLFEWILRQAPTVFQDQLGEDMRLAFNDICLERASADGNLGVANELISTFWDMGKVIFFLYVWMLIDIGNKNILSLTSSALIFRGVGYFSPICPYYLTGGKNAPNKKIGFH